MDKVLVICCFLGLLLYYNTLKAGFVYDDSRAILSNPDVLPSTPLLNIWVNDFWGTPLASSSSHGSYRPLCMIAFRLNYFYCGLKPFCYHLTNVFLYILSIILVNRLARSLLPSDAAKLAVLFFTVHPIHTEAVAGIVGRADLLSCIFYLFSLLSYLKHIKYRNKAAFAYHQSCNSYIPNGGGPKLVNGGGPKLVNGGGPKLVNGGGPKLVNGGGPKLVNGGAMNGGYSNGGHVHRHSESPKSNGGKSFYNGDVASSVSKHNLKSLSINARLKFLFELFVNFSVSFSIGKVKHSVYRMFGLSNVVDEIRNCSDSVLKWVSLILTVLFASAAMISKETGVTVLAVCALLDLIYSRRSLFSKDSAMMSSLMVVGCSSVFLLLFRYYMMGTHTAPTFSTADNPTAKSNSFLVRTATFLYLPVFNLSLLILPINLSFDWSMDAVPRIQTIFDRRNLFSLIFYFSIYKLIKSSYIKIKLYDNANYSAPSGKYPNRYTNCTTNGGKYQNRCTNFSVNSKYSNRFTNCSAPSNKYPNRYANGSAVNGKYSNHFEESAASRHFTTQDHHTQKTHVIRDEMSFYTGPCAPRLSFIEPFKHSVCKTCKYVKMCAQHSAACRINNNNNNYNSHSLNQNNFSNSRYKVFRSCICMSPSEPSLSLLRFRCGWPCKHDRKSGHHQTVLVCLALTVLPFLPATNLFFYVGFVVAERVLFTPSIGFCFLLALGFDLVEKRSNCRLMQSLAYIVLIAFSAKTVHRNRDWLDEESLYRASLRINPPKAYGNLGSVLSSQGRFDEAEYALKMALKHRPNMADAHYNLGVLHQNRHQYEDAIRSYKLAIQFRSSLALAHLNLGQLLGSVGRCEEAEAVLTQCANLSGEGLKDIHTHEMTRISALLHLGRLHADRGRYQDAVEVYKRAVRDMPPYYQPQILFNLLGEALSRLGKIEAAEYWYQAALQAKPDHVPAHLTYGKLLARNKTRILEAELWFQKAQKLAPKDPSVHQHFGQFLAERERYSEAAYHFVKAVELAPSEYDLVVAAATALRQAGHGQKAEQMYRRAVKLKPTESSSHSNLGAMLHLNGRYQEAIESYSEALRLDPQDATTLHNLEKLEKLMSRVKT